MKMLLKWISVCLAICLMLSVLPVQALAAQLPAPKANLHTNKMQVSSEETMGEKPLFEAYALQQFYGSNGSYYGTEGGARLNNDERSLYNGLKNELEKIASGQRESAIISVGEDVEYEGEIYYADQRAYFRCADLTQQMLDRVIEALLADMPYDLYWYDKVTGVEVITFTGDKLYQVIFGFTVAQNYRGEDVFTANTAQTGKVTRAVNNAKAIVAKHAARSDYEKLGKYRDEIRSLVTYDYDAAYYGYFTTDVDPWQLISVFDGDPTTNVVCEGYAKAFMYLCDISYFSENVTCHTVTGEMNGVPHMWNIVRMYDRSNYLVDVTNYDSGAYSALFMGGTTGSVLDGYTFAGLHYTYDQNMLNLWGAQDYSLLELAPKPFNPNLNSDTVDAGQCGDNVKWKLTRDGELIIGGTGAMYDFGNMGVPWDPYCERIQSITVGTGVTYVGDFAFQYCSNARSIIVPSTVTAIGQRAFAYCSNAQTIWLPEGLTSISNGLFYNCANMKRVKIPEGVTAIGNEAFIGCSGLTEVELPGKVTSIGDSAFMYCTSLKKISLPVGVKSVGVNAFYRCGNLTDVYYGGSKAQWEQIAIGANNAELTFAVIHYNSAFLKDAPVVNNLTSKTDGIYVSWDRVQGVMNYRVFVKTSKGWAPIGDTTDFGLLYTDAKNGLNYTFTVRGLSEDGKAYITEYNKAGWKHTYQPTPEITRFETTTKGIKITWSAINGVEKYRVFAKTSKGWTKVGDTAGTSFVWNGAKVGNAYTFTVRGLNAAGTAYTTPYNTTGWKHSYAAQPVITGIESASPGIRITWDPVARAGGYRIFVKTSKGWAKLGDAYGTEFRWTGAKAGESYTFTIRALSSSYIDSGGGFFISTYNTAGWKHTYYPTPEITKLESTTGGIKLTWDKINGAGKYRVFAKTSKGWTKIGDTTGNTFTWSGAKTGLTYTFTVRGMNANASAFVTAYNNTGWKHKYMPTPTITRFESAANGVKLTWSAINGADKYRVFVKTSKGWAALGDTTGTSYTWTGAKTGVRYTFTVRAVNAAGTGFTSSYSTVGWDYTYYPAPAVKLANAANGIQISWGAINGAGKYRVFVKKNSGWTKLADVTGTAYTYTGAKTGMTYTFTVRAMNAAGTEFISSYNSAGWSITSQ